MKEFLSTYIELLQNNHDMVGQVHSEFKRQFLEMTVDKLLEQFVLSKYTGLEKPGRYSLGRQKIKSQMEVIRGRVQFIQSSFVDIESHLKLVCFTAQPNLLFLSVQLK